ncbi:MAG: cytochrome b/b6 domain-containing protein [Desulfotignum sp.]|nr:cytochrome b/b6 domain-containing protein [Desulfotignum sp.]MCF8126481.1 cytochrome b/b6 domain-containing protein [Desulfotignum sp.]
MTEKKIINVYLYTRFERLWHWSQALMIIILMITGFEVHGLYSLMGFETAVEVHNFVGLFWLGSFAFFAFWLIITGEWKQYIPTTRKLFDVALYYAWGIFHGQNHPVQKTPGAKHNPLQRLAYLGISAMLLPLQMVTGLLYYLYNSLPGMPLAPVAVIHTLAAFLLVNFLIIHVYMTTTGHSLFSHIKGMITGWEEIYDTTKIEEWETKATRKA